MKIKTRKSFIILLIAILAIVCTAIFLSSSPANNKSKNKPANNIIEDNKIDKKDDIKEDDVKKDTTAEDDNKKDSAVKDTTVKKNDTKKTTKNEHPDEDAIAEKANKILARMTLREKLYQMFIVTPDTLSGEKNIKDFTPLLKKGIDAYPVGGIIFFAGNIESSKQVKNLIEECNLQSEIPMFFATDQEGGMVARLKENVNFPIFRNMYKYKDMGEATAYENAKTIAVNMAELGFNLDFAPVADVWTNKENTVIGERAYSDDYVQAAFLIENAVKGFNDGGVICTLKHFPGHGNTYADTHKNLAYVSKTKEQLLNEELLPFKSGIKAGADMVMAGHLIVPEIDKENPATLSKALLTDLLKEDLGYEGIIITDALNMGAVANMYSSGQLCKMAVKAGVDILLMPIQLRAGAAGIESAVLSGEISEERINESVLKILKLKIKRGIIK